MYYFPLARHNRSMAGRKAKPDAERKDSVIYIRVTQEQKAAIEQAAERAGLSVAAYTRMAVLEKAGS